MIIFQNPGLIDIRAVTTFGVSVKGTTSAIGKFGTGLKYAIAVILREGGSITIWRGLTAYEFVTDPTDINGKSFDIVRMDWHDENGSFNSVPLAFTTEHGKMWEPWQAFRELWSNMHDEGGKCWHDTAWPEALTGEYPAKADHTTIVVTGEAMEKAWEGRGSIILETEPMKVLDGVAVHAGESKHLYYQGIRVFDLERPSKYTYNLLSNQQLSEDRKLVYLSVAVGQITRAIMTSSWAAHIDDVLRTDDSKLEGRLSWKDQSTTVPSPTFVEVAQGVRDERGLKGNAKQLFTDLANSLTTHYGYSDPREAAITPVEQAIIDDALKLVKAASIKMEGIRFRARSGWSKDTKVLLSADRSAIIFSTALLVEGNHIDVAKQIVRAMAMKAGGARELQLANFILFGVFEEQEGSYEDEVEWNE